MSSVDLSRLVRHQGWRLATDLVPDLYVMCRLSHGRKTDDDSDCRNDHRVDEAAERDACRLDDRRTDSRDAAAEPAVADVVRHRHRAVADLRREQFDEECG